MRYIWISIAEYDLYNNVTSYGNLSHIWNFKLSERGCLCNGKLGNQRYQETSWGDKYLIVTFKLVYDIKKKKYSGKSNNCYVTWVHLFISLLMILL